MIIHLNFIFIQVNKQICILERNCAIYKSYFQVKYYYQYTLSQKKRYNSTSLSYLFQQRLRNFKINFQADQGFIKEFKEQKKTFLTSRREHFYKDNHTPAPGVYSDQLLITEPGQSIEFNINPQMINSLSSIFQRDFSHFQFLRMNDNSPDLQRTISRNKACQRKEGEHERMSTFYISNNNMGNQIIIEQQIAVMRQRSQNNQMLLIIIEVRFYKYKYLIYKERYGFKKLKGGKIKKQRLQTAANG
ncbi:unnamed protein product [Paramecium primaurelia]|uniref:Uncharacterized protein n=1 Tax=Paramecium primaurelia TaxID=5886 RepID=A0A8S1NRA7_PARPR|nr:unnamed protein product [Paramecium primaurelia]CAD8118425.1 unnamed protein product [Paramecium primaurelia]